MSDKSSSSLSGNDLIDINPVMNHLFSDMKLFIESEKPDSVDGVKIIAARLAAMELKFRFLRNEILSKKAPMKHRMKFLETSMTSAESSVASIAGFATCVIEKAENNM